MVEAVRQAKKDSSSFGQPIVGIINAYNRFSRIAAIISTLIGTYVFLSWAFDIREITTIAHDWPSMKVNSSIAFIFAGLSLLLLLPNDVRSKRNLTGTLFGLICALIGLMTLAEEISGRDFGIDQLILQDTLPTLYGRPGRMSPVTALCILLLGIALSQMNTKKQLIKRIRGVLAIIVAVTSFFIILLFTYGEPVLPLGLTKYTQMAFHTAGLLFLLSLGVLFSRHEDIEIIGHLALRTPGALLLRRTLPTIILTFLLIGWLRSYGQHAGLFGIAFGYSLSMVSFTGIVISLIFIIAKKLDNSEKEKLVLVEKLVQEEIHRKYMSNIGTLVEHSLDAVVGMTSKGDIMDWNKTAELIFGREKSEAIGHNLANLIIPSKYREAHNSGLDQFLNTGVGPILNKRVELSALRRDRREFPIELSVIPIKEKQDFVFYAFIRDISDRKNFEERQKALIEEEHNARLAAELSMNMRDDFLSIAAHELRTPITPIVIQLQLLEKELRKDTEITSMKHMLLKWTERSRKEIDRLLRITEYLLEVSRISGGRLLLNLEEVNLSKIVQLQIENQRQTSFRTGSELHTRIEPNVVGHWDAPRLESIVGTLLENAIKYGEGSPIDIELETKEGSAILLVQDHGIGISKHNQQKIFEKFGRASSVKNYGGFGLGLYISSEVVKAHGGFISVKSSPMEGSTFQVVLPLGLQK